MKYIGLVRPAAPGTKCAKVEIISAEKGAKVPDGTVLLEISRAKEVIGCYIAFDKFMHKGTGSAQIICSKIKKVDPPKQEEKIPEPQEEIASEPQPTLMVKEIEEPEAKTFIDSEIPVSTPEPPQPDVEKLQQQIESLRGNLTRADSANEKLKKRIKKLESEIKDLKEADKLILGGEELFQGEKKDMVLAAITEVLKGLEDGTRRSDVLRGILDANEYEKLLEKKREAVEKIFKGYAGLSGTMEKKLADLGLMISDVGRHYKIRYYNDSRYWLTMAKTPSDSVHGDKTLIAKIKKKML